MTDDEERSQRWWFVHVLEKGCEADVTDVVTADMWSAKEPHQLVPSPTLPLNLRGEHVTEVGVHLYT